MSPDPYLFLSHWDDTVQMHPGSPRQRRRRLVPRETYEEVMGRLGLAVEGNGPERAPSSPRRGPRTSARARP